MFIDGVLLVEFNHFDTGDSWNYGMITEQAPLFDRLYRPDPCVNIA